MRLAIQASLAQDPQAFGGLSVQQVLDLQFRDITPSDYETLLALDSAVKPKTLSRSVLDSFPVTTLAAAANSRCTVCQCDLDAGDTIRTLRPCGHVFHDECICRWLSTSSTKCPVDGLSLDPAK